MSGINLSHLLTSGEYSDLTIIASGVHFKVHRCIVFSQCEAWKNLAGEYMYSGTYVTENIRCHVKKPTQTGGDSGKTDKSSAVANDSQDHLSSHGSDKLSYEDHSMLLSACVMIDAKKFKMKDLEIQAKNALVAVAPSLTEHADFIFTIEHILKHYQDHEGLDIVLRMIRPKFLKSLGMRRRLQAVMKSHPQLAMELIEPLVLELDKREMGHTHTAQDQHTMIKRDYAGSSTAVAGPQPASIQQESKRPNEEELEKPENKIRRTGN
ncbi:uncharacterized protein ColSpa_08642 [Colletotrichum spaethianum]|uniref:BTB domain-containing protein n=1 Tax=Colletotrichum spaethianum TaxID=700344 RepID=A0AA37PA76_9PEZI|nr:uncharacterized protein ColSpa_08642 [Colletotrichum spaethianum]GKT48461.1 hypothetical protein ColSpa_08642 [Colletotrichum spaethianum]